MDDLIVVVMVVLFFIALVSVVYLLWSNSTLYVGVGDNSVVVNASSISQNIKNTNITVSVHSGE